MTHLHARPRYKLGSAGHGTEEGRQRGNQSDGGQMEGRTSEPRGLSPWQYATGGGGEENDQSGVSRYRHHVSWAM